MNEKLNHKYKHWFYNLASFDSINLQLNWAFDTLPFLHITIHHRVGQHYIRETSAVDPSHMGKCVGKKLCLYYVQMSRTLIGKGGKAEVLPN